MNISVLIPSRFRVRRLKKCIQSVLSTAARPDSIEFILRLHDDDKETLKEVPALSELGHVHTIVGKNEGYTAEHLYMWELSQRAQGQWIFGLNDDTVVLKQSQNWDAQVMLKPLTGVLCLPQYHCLGTSIYKNDPKCPFNLLPNRWWEQFGIKQFEHPSDAFMRQIIRKREKWRCEFISKMMVHHDRRPDRLMKDENRA